MMCPASSNATFHRVDHSAATIPLKTPVIRQTPTPTPHITLQFKPFASESTQSSRLNLSYPLSIPSLIGSISPLIIFRSQSSTNSEVFLLAVHVTLPDA